MGFHFGARAQSTKRRGSNGGGALLEPLEERKLLSLTVWDTPQGGNGNAYEAVAQYVTWDEAYVMAKAMGGHLATITSKRENEFVFGLIDSPLYWENSFGVMTNGPWIGAFQPAGSIEPKGGWTWVTGEPFIEQFWHVGAPDLGHEPNNYGEEHHAQYWVWGTEGRAPTWNDADGRLKMPGFVIEYEAPTARLADPLAGGVIDQRVLNERGYIEVTFVDYERALHEDSIMDNLPEFKLVGSGATSVVVDPRPTRVGEFTYRYRFDGRFNAGPITVDFLKDSWADRSGLGGVASSESFTIQRHTEYTLPGLGDLSEWYESGGRGPGTISNGARWGDPGGNSYGLYQFSINQGTLEAFVNQYYRQEFAGLTLGSDAFNDRWREIARESPEAFADAQFAFTKEWYYDRQVAQLNATYGFDINERSRALQNVIWSTAVQHGIRSLVLPRVFDALRATTSLSALDDAEIVRAIYAERGRVDASGILVYFPSSPQNVQTSLRVRFRSELNDALSALAAEREFYNPFAGLPQL